MFGFHSAHLLDESLIVYQLCFPSNKLYNGLTWIQYQSKYQGRVTRSILWSLWERSRQGMLLPTIRIRKRKKGTFLLYMSLPWISKSALVQTSFFSPLEPWHFHLKVFQCIPVMQYMGRMLLKYRLEALIGSLVNCDLITEVVSHFFTRMNLNFYNCH